MAKGKSNRGSATGTPSSLTQLLALPKTPTAIRSSLTIQDPIIQNSIQQEREYVKSLEDRRTFHPAGKLNRPAAATPRSASRLTAYSSRAITVGDVPDRIAFSLPQKVAICVRRKIRREVVHALQLHRRHGSGSGRRRRTPYSGIKC